MRREHHRVLRLYRLGSRPAQPGRVRRCRRRAGRRDAAICPGARLIPESITLSLLASARATQANGAGGGTGEPGPESVQRARWSLVQLRHTYVCIPIPTWPRRSQRGMRLRIEIALAATGLARRFPAYVPDALLFAALADWRLGKPDPAHGRAIPQEHHDRPQAGMRDGAGVAQYWLGCFAQSSAGASWVPEGAEPHLRAALATFEHFKAAGMEARHPGRPCNLVADRSSVRNQSEAPPSRGRPGSGGRCDRDCPTRLACALPRVTRRRPWWPLATPTSSAESSPGSPSDSKPWLRPQSIRHQRWGARRPPRRRSQARPEDTARMHTNPRP